VAGCGLRLHPLFDYFSAAPHAPGQNYAFLKVHLYVDARDRLVVDQPLPTKAPPLPQQSFAGDLVDVQGHGVAGLRFAAIAALPPTSASAHFYPPRFLSKSFGKFDMMSSRSTMQIDCYPSWMQDSKVFSSSLKCCKFLMGF
jgi:hypothetical protein